MTTVRELIEALSALPGETPIYTIHQGEATRAESLSQLEMGIWERSNGPALITPSGVELKCWSSEAEILGVRVRHFTDWDCASVRDLPDSLGHDALEACGVPEMAQVCLAVARCPDPDAFARRWESVTGRELPGYSRVHAREEDE